MKRGFHPKHVFQWVTLAWLCGWFVKAAFFVPYLFLEAEMYPIDHALFPIFFKSPLVVQFFYLFPLLGFLCFFVSHDYCYKGIAIILLCSSAILCLHFATYNDATFVTSSWVALWLLWLSFHLKEENQISLDGCFLAKCLLGMIFLGGLVGKLTHAYWSGEVVYQIFFNQAPHFPFTFFIKGLSPQQQLFLASGVAKTIILTEAFLVFTPLIPMRFIGLLAPFILSFLMIFSTWMILSVIACLIGLMLVCWFWDRSANSQVVDA